MHKNLTLDPSAASMNLPPNPSTGIPNVSSAAPSSSSSSTSCLSSSNHLPLALSLSHLVPADSATSPAAVSSAPNSLSVHLTNNLHNQSTHLNQLLTPSSISIANNNSNSLPVVSTSHSMQSFSPAAHLAASLFSSPSVASHTASDPHQHLSQQLLQQQSLFQSQYHSFPTNINMNRVKSTLVTKVRPGSQAGVTSLLSLPENGTSTKTKADRKFAPY